MEKKKIITIFVLFITVALAGAALFFALKLYQAGQEKTVVSSPKPIAEKEIPFIAEMEAPGVCELAFIVSSPPTPTPAPTPTSAPAPTSTPTPVPTPSPSPLASLSPSPAPTAAPLAYLPPTPPPAVPSTPPPPAPQPQTVPTQQLPEAGIISPTLIFLLGGLLLLTIGILL